MEENKIKDNKNPQPLSSRTATPSKKTYSAEELAEIYLNSRPDFLGLDMEEVTREWNLDFIFDFLYLIKDEQSISSAIEWIIEMWKEKHGVLDSYTNASSIELMQLKDKFCADMFFILESLHSRYEDERRKEELRQKMLNGYTTSTLTHQPDEVVVEEDSSTDEPVFQQVQTSEAPKYHVPIEELPDNVQSKVLVSQGVMDVLVKQLNEDTWLIVEQKKVCIAT